jgi:anti-anti-sigma factor
MEINTKQAGTVAQISIQGSVDGLTAGSLMDSLAALVHSGQSRLVVDFSGVDYISSAGLRALLATVKESRQAGGDLRLSNVSADVNRVLELSGFTNILKVFPDLAAATESFGA